MSEHHHHYLTAPEDGFPFGFLLLRSPSSLITASPACPSELSHLSRQGQGKIRTPRGCGCQTRPQRAAGGTQPACASRGGVPCTSTPVPFTSLKGSSAHTQTPQNLLIRESWGTNHPPARKGYSCPEPPGHTWHRHPSPRSCQRRRRRNWQPVLFIEQFKHY